MIIFASLSSGSLSMQDTELAVAIFKELTTFWCSNNISLELKIRLYKKATLSIAIYSAETRRMTAKIPGQFDVFHQRCLRKTLRITYRDRVADEAIH